MTHEVSSLLNIHNGAEIPAVLFHGGNNNGSAITLKGTDGGRLAFVFKYFVPLLIRLSRGDVGLYYSGSWNIQQGPPRHEVGSENIFISEINTQRCLLAVKR